MKGENKYITLLLLVVFDLTSSAMVLPRPPSPNHIQEDHELNDRKIYAGDIKAGYAARNVMNSHGASCAIRLSVILI
ncbi:hypothetical protein M0802_014377 [Mischocyttarus mexicanus]|nr:hypothetical protein M0802_014377 [Mischocyttarus mexicanus]